MINFHKRKCLDMVCQNIIFIVRGVSAYHSFVLIMHFSISSFHFTNDAFWFLVPTINYSILMITWKFSFKIMFKVYLWLLIIVQLTTITCPRQSCHLILFNLSSHILGCPFYHYACMHLYSLQFHRHQSKETIYRMYWVDSSVNFKTQNTITFLPVLLE